MAHLPWSNPYYGAPPPPQKPEKLDAIDSPAQIAILADLNGCSKDEIVEILREGGCELPKQYTKKTERAEAPAQATQRERLGDPSLERLAIYAIRLQLAETRGEEEEIFRDRVIGILAILDAAEDAE